MTELTTLANTTPAIRGMIADFKVLLDSCVLANFGVCDIYLRLAEHPRLILPKWTDDILGEVYRTQTDKLNWNKNLADSFHIAVRNAFPEAMITGYEALISVMTNHEKDRHVLAAAVKEKLDIIITFNLKDFEMQHLEKWGVKAVHPDAYLTTLFEINPTVVLSRISDISRKRKLDMESVIIDLGKTLPGFSDRLLESMGR